MKQQRPYPQLVITKKGARAIESGHPWVFEGEVLALEPSPIGGTPATNGCLVDVVQKNGSYLGTGLLSQKSKIRARLISRNANDRFDEAFWLRKATWAWQYRQTVMGQADPVTGERDTDCCRVIFSEADGFGGLTIDRYGDVLVSQVTTVGMERLRPVVYPAVLNALAQGGAPIQGIYERNDGAVRTLEGLERYQGWWRSFDEKNPASSLLVDSATLSTQRLVRENGISYQIDLEHSQKTGFFLDQKYNRQAVAKLSGGRRVLDCFSHVGSFGLNAAQGGAERVRCVDISQVACDLVAVNAQLNGYEETVSATCADVFGYLDALLASRSMQTDEGGPFDLIVLDPPAFTKSRAKQASAARGYREINNQAMRLLPRGGYLATCSCSHHMPAHMLKAAIAEAAHDAHVQLRQIEERQQAPDHPIVWGIPETHYLDFLLFQVV